jgi:hypothetical protein
MVPGGEKLGVAKPKICVCAVISGDADGRVVTMIGCEACTTRKEAHVIVRHERAHELARCKHGINQPCPETVRRKRCMLCPTCMQLVRWRAP